MEKFSSEITEMSDEALDAVAAGDDGSGSVYGEDPPIAYDPNGALDPYYGD